MLNLIHRLSPKGTSFRHIPIQHYRNVSFLKDSKSQVVKNIVSVRRNVRFHPEHLQIHDFVNFSDVTRPCICWKLGYEHAINVHFNYGVIDHVKQPFPPGTKGYLYWHHDPRLPVTTGELRFRLMRDNYPENFLHGTDLIDLSGVPWSVKLLRIAREKKRWGLQRLIVQSRLINHDVFEQMSEAFERRNAGSKKTRAELYYLEQPFVLNLEQYMCYLRIVTPDLVQNYDLQTPFPDTSFWKPAYSGRIIVNYERVTLPERTSTSLVLRVTKILEPPKAILSTENTGHLLPQAGRFLEHLVNGQVSPRTFALPYHQLLPSIYAYKPFTEGADRRGTTLTSRSWLHKSDQNQWASEREAALPPRSRFQDR